MKLKRIFWRALLVLVAAYILWLSYLLLTFRTYKGAGLPAASPKIPPAQMGKEPAPLETLSPDSLIEIEGVYHLHTKLSDGWKTADQVAKTASETAVDFIILADHGRPNFDSLRCEGWKEKVLVLAGSELSENRGHLVGLGFAPPSRQFSQIAENAVSEIKDLGGFTVIAHPDSKTRWTWGEFVDYSGMELVNVDTIFKKKTWRLLPYLPVFFIKPQLVMLKMLKRPAQNLKKWDTLSRIRPFFGYFSTDAHMFYRPALSLLRIHVLLEEPLSQDFTTAMAQVYDALKKGLFYNAVESAADARGFRFWAERRSRFTHMGGERTISNWIALNVRAPFPFATEIHLLQNGHLRERIAGGPLSLKIKEAGVYRVEVYLKEKSALDEKFPWIVSNPIFLRKEKKDALF
jgi:hypothetical protein